MGFENEIFIVFLDAKLISQFKI